MCCEAFRLVEKVSCGKSRHDNVDYIVKGDGESSNRSPLEVKGKLPIAS